MGNPKIHPGKHSNHSGNHFAKTFFFQVKSHLGKRAFKEQLVASLFCLVKCPNKQKWQPQKMSLFVRAATHMLDPALSLLACGAVFHMLNKEATDQVSPQRVKPCCTTN